MSMAGESMIASNRAMTANHKTRKGAYNAASNPAQTRQSRKLVLSNGPATVGNTATSKAMKLLNRGYTFSIISLTISHSLEWSV